MNLRKEDIETLRTLAERMMNDALSDKNHEKRELWRSLNQMHMQKPMISIEQMPWDELDVDGSLVCTVENKVFRRIEWNLRTDLYKWEHMPADMVLNPYILLPRPISNTGYGLSTVYKEVPGAEPAQSHLFADQFSEMEDVEKIQTPVITVDYAAETEILETAHRVFDGIAPVKWEGMMLHSGLWDKITFWKGVENCYFDLLDRPELLHAIIERLTEAVLSEIEQYNHLGIYDIHSNMCHCSYTFDDRLPSETCDREHPTTFDGWTYSMAQLFTSVSPQINEEFEVPYISRILEKFGAAYYGCCERLDDRLDVVTKLPNIRKISCSPWSNRERFAAELPKQYIMSNKPNPAFLAEDTLDEELVRDDLRRTIAAAKAHGLGLEFLLKDISTVRHDPARLWRWAEIAEEESIRAEG